MPAPRRTPSPTRQGSPKNTPPTVDAEVREKLHLEILRRTGAYRTDDHFLLPSGHHAPEYIDKALVTTEPSFTEGLGAVIGKHFSPWPVDVVLSTGVGALILAHCVARTLPSHPVLMYATKGVAGPSRHVTLPLEFERHIRRGIKVLIVEDLITTGRTLELLTELVEGKGGSVMGIACLWQRASSIVFRTEVFSLVRRDFPTYEPADCPLCRQGVPLNVEFARAELTGDDASEPRGRPAG